MKWDKETICEVTAIAGFLCVVAGCNIQWSMGVAFIVGGCVLLIGGVWGALR